MLMYMAGGVTGIMSKNEPFIESRKAALPHHADGAVRGSPVGGATGVHEARLDDIDRRRHDSGAESGTERRNEMTEHVVCI